MNIQSTNVIKRKHLGFINTVFFFIAICMSFLFMLNDAYAKGAKINIIFTDGPPGPFVELSQERKNAILQAARNWEQVLDNDVELNIEAYGFAILSGFLAAGRGTFVVYTSPENNPGLAYNTVRARLIQNNNADEVVLPTYEQFSATVPQELSDAIQIPGEEFIEWKPNSVTVTRSTAKALNLLDSHGKLTQTLVYRSLTSPELKPPPFGTGDGDVDGTIIMAALDNDVVRADLDPNDGIGLNLPASAWFDIRFNDSDTFPSDDFFIRVYDYVGIANHEIGHAIGWQNSTIDYDNVNFDPTNPENNSVLRFGISPLDMFRVRKADALEAKIKNKDIRLLKRHLVSEADTSFIQFFDVISGKDLFQERNDIQTDDAAHVFIANREDLTDRMIELQPDYTQFDFSHLRARVNGVADFDIGRFVADFPHTNFVIPGPYDENGDPLYGQKEELMVPFGLFHSPRVITETDLYVLDILGFKTNPQGLRCQNQFLPEEGEECNN